jgi:arylsulfatase A-like enzyme
MKTVGTSGTETDGRHDSDTQEAIETRVELVVPRFSIDRSLAMGAAWGVVAWSAYGLLEYVLGCVRDLFSADRAVFVPLNWELTSWLFNAYWVAGAISGAICGALVARLPVASARRDDRLRLAGTCGLLIAALLTILTVPRMQFGARNVLAIDTVLLLPAVWVIIHPHSRLAPWIRIPPFLLVLLMQFPVWLGAEIFGESGGMLRRSVMGLVIAAILATAYFLRRFRDWTATRHLVANLAALMLVIVASALVSGANRTLPSPPASFSADPGTPPVILISLDTTRADHLSVYGYSRKTTPNLEQLARQATLYANAQAAADWTLPSHASMFTGVYSSWHGAHNFALQPIVIQPLDDKLPTLASILRDRGVFTVGVAANKAYLPPEWGIGRGFQSYNVQAPVEFLSSAYTYNLRNGMRRLLSCCFETASFDMVYRQALDVNRDAIGAVEDPHVRNRSFFLFINYMDAHSPYVSPAPRGASLPSGRGAPNLAEYEHFAENVLQGRGVYPEPALTLTLERYDAGIAAEDEAIGDLMAWLKRRDLFDRALIIVTADHGEAFGVHNIVGHGVGTYQSQVHVPLLIKYPRQSQSRVVAEPVSHVDILPTVLAVLGISPPSQVQGVSLLNDQALVGRVVFAESFQNNWLGKNIPRFQRTERAARMGDYKLIVSDKGKREFFNLAQDPQELHNLTARGLPEAQSIDEFLRRWIGEIPAQTKQTTPLNQRQMDRLKGLGYVR